MYCISIRAALQHSFIDFHRQFIYTFFHTQGPSGTYGTRAQCLPGTPLDFYECRRGLGYSRFKGVKNGLEADILAFVPFDVPCEINRLTLKKTSGIQKDFSVFSYVEFCLWNAVDDSTNFQRNLSTGEVEIEGSTIYHKTEYRERRNHYSFFTVNSDADGLDTKHFPDKKVAFRKT